MRRSSQGIALVTALAILAIVTLLVLGTVFTTQIESWSTRNDTTSTQAYYIAHAGLEKYKTIAFQTFRFYLDNLQQYGSQLGTSAICGNLLASGLDLNRDFTISASDGDLMPGGSKTENYAGGTYTITFALSGPDVVLTSVGRIHGAKATDQVVFRPKNAGLFSNALFAGNGLAGNFINGGAAVWGSVYVQGPDPSSSSTPPTVLNSNGNFSMHNFYFASDTDTTNPDNLVGMMGANFTTSQLQAMLGSTATDQTNLCGRLRVAYGQVSVGGNTTLGESGANAPSSSYVSSLSGVNVYQGSSDITTSGSTAIYADNYPNGNLSFDLTKTVQFPTFAGTTGKCGSAWQTCLLNDATTFDAGTAASTCDLASIASGTTLAFDTTPVDCLVTDPTTGKVTGFDYYQDTSGNWTLQVQGLVNFSGYDVHFARSVTTRFVGKATIMASTDSQGNGGNITVDGNILPSTNQICSTTSTGTSSNCHTPNFPNDETLGLIAQNDLTFTGSAQAQSTTGTTDQVATGLFYAGNLATIAKNATVLGTVMGNEISTTSNTTGGQTPNIVQVPGLEYNLAPGFTEIPTDVLATFRILSYERR